LQLIEDAELHDAVSPKFSCKFSCRLCFCRGHLNGRGGAVYAVAIPPCGRTIFVRTSQRAVREAVLRQSGDLAN
jgi:hypothetical protein